MGRASRDKGARGERLWAAFCREAGFDDVKRGCQLYQRGSVIADVIGLPGIHQEIKFVEKLNVRAAMEQSETDAGENETPIVAHKTSRKEWLVTMRAADWMKMYKAFLGGANVEDKTKPTQKQIDFALSLLKELGYDEEDVPELTGGTEFDDLTRGQMSKLIEGLKNELDGNY